MFWKTHGLNKLSEDHLFKVWTWMFSLPVDEIALQDKIAIAMQITGQEITGEVNQFAEQVRGYKDWDDEDRKIYQKKLFMNKQRKELIAQNKIKKIKRLMWNPEIAEKIYYAGVESAKKLEKDEKLKGALRGFEIFRKCRSIYELENKIAAHQKKEHEYFMRRDEIKNIHKKYTEYRYETLQLQYGYEFMKVAFRKSGLFEYLSAQSVIKFASLFGIADKSE